MLRNPVFPNRAPNRVGYGVTFWNASEHDIYISWRASLAVILVPCLIFGVGLPFLPESPRWLVEHGHYQEAQKSLHWLREGSFTEEQIGSELARIRENVEEHRTSGTNWLSLFKDRNLFNRLWRASLLQFMAQMCGATAMKYYLPTLFAKLGLPTRVTLMAGGIESTLKIGMTVIEMILIDRLGRRVTLTVGCVAMGFGIRWSKINGVLGRVYPNNANSAADVVCIVFIFIYALGYSMGFGPAAWVYGSEIFPTSVRARGLNFSASGGAIGSIVVAQVWPIGIDTIGSNVYFFFMAVNFICIPVSFGPSRAKFLLTPSQIIILFYPETKGRPLEDMDLLFRKGVIIVNEGVDEHTEPVLPKNVSRPFQS
ncbi:hypothetical protein AAE478_008184 [Parahypoxylon ruwenzoriense]